MARPAAEHFKSAKGNDVYKFHGSVYGGCLHSQVLALGGAEPAAPVAAVQRVFEWGHQREAVVKRDLLAAGLPLFYASDNVSEQLQLSLFEQYDDAGKVWLLLSLHPDGIAQLPEGVDPSSLLAGAHFHLAVGLHNWRPGTLALVECKTAKGGKDGDFDDYVKVGLAKNQRYQYQVDGSQHAAKNSKEVKELRLGPVEGTLFLVEERVYDKATQSSTPGQRLAMFIPQPVHTLDECMGRCRQVVDMHRAGIVPECDSKYSCSYKTAVPKVIEDLDESDDLHELTGDFAQARTDAAFHAELLNSARKSLIDALGGSPRTVRAAGHIVDYRVDKRGRGTLTVERDQ